MRIRCLVLSILSALVLGLALPALADTAPTTGKLVFTFDVTVNSFVPFEGYVMCTVTATVTEEGGQTVTQQAIGVAFPTGGKATCVADMPYSWELASASSDKVKFSSTIELDHAFAAKGFNVTPVTLVLFENKVTQNIGSMPVPLNGATTNVTVSAII